jgi:hypothetical protein
VSTAGAATAISATATVSNLVWDKSPADIRTLHEQTLAAMGVRPEAVRAFVTNRWFTPTLSVPFVEHLVAMPDAKGRAEVVGLAGTVASEGEARFLLNSVAMARRAGTPQDPVAALQLDGRILAVRTRSGRVDVPAPVDYVPWTDRVSALAAKGAKEGRRTLQVTGIASERAREGFRVAGWTLQERAAR